MYYSINMNISENYLSESMNIDSYFSEAVFSGGKEKVKPLEEHIQKIKDELDSQLKEQDETIEANKKDKSVKIKSFDPKAFWKNTLFKDFEDAIRDIFGFRNVEIHPYIEKYNSKDKKFESCELNCAVYHIDRFPIEGLVTDKGFYDKTHSTVMQIYISLGLIKTLTTEEILSVFLHEFGHSIDPALVDIKYTETNILSKYITDRKKDINKEENKLIDKIGKKLKSIGSDVAFITNSLIDSIIDIFRTKDSSMKNKLKKLKEKLSNDKEVFNRQNYSEAFADNFARMYGYGHVLMKGIKKLSSNIDNEINSRYKKEKARQKIIYEITKSMIDDEHKTDIHRIRSLINEYKKDIDDPATPKVVKEQLKEDLKELEEVLDQYLNHKDEFQKRVNNLINEELMKLEDDSESSDKNNKDDEAIKEGFIFFNEDYLITERRKAYETLMKAKESLNPEEHKLVVKCFGSSTECSFGKDKNGYYCFTHRCRSKSYPTINDIPQKDVDFVSSTS